jgi:hypothetical protein
MHMHAYGRLSSLYASVYTEELSTQFNESLLCKSADVHILTVAGVSAMEV